MRKSTIRWLLFVPIVAAFLHPDYSFGTRRRASASSSSSNAALTQPICEYHVLTIPIPDSLQNNNNNNSQQMPQQEIHVMDVTPQIRELLQNSGMKQGLLTVASRHTTTGITINEQETRLARDLRQWLLQLAPPDERSVAATVPVVLLSKRTRYQHNDLHLRPESEAEEQRCLENGWNIHDPVQLQKWRDQEPINAHSHLAAMLLGSTESIPVCDGKLTLGSWQSILLVDLDGPRERTVGVQFMGYL